VIDGLPAGATLRYYVEARAADRVGTTTFSPATAELGALTYKVPTSRR
jgi:hypothetical protein